MARHADETDETDDAEKIAFTEMRLMLGNEMMDRRSPRFLALKLAQGNVVSENQGDVLDAPLITFIKRFKIQKYGEQGRV
jgi:hypothetical protein